MKKAKNRIATQKNVTTPRMALTTRILVKERPHFLQRYGGRAAGGATSKGNLWDDKKASKQILYFNPVRTIMTVRDLTF
jgi:hypothetical protein